MQAGAALDKCPLFASSLAGRGIHNHGWILLPGKEGSAHLIRRPWLQGESWVAMAHVKGGLGEPWSHFHPVSGWAAPTLCRGWDQRPLLSSNCCTLSSESWVKDTGRGQLPSPVPGFLAGAPKSSPLPTI